MTTRHLLGIAAIMALGAAASVLLGLVWPPLNDNLPFQIMLGFTVGLFAAPLLGGRRGGGHRG